MTKKIHEHLAEIRLDEGLTNGISGDNVVEKFDNVVFELRKDVQNLKKEFKVRKSRKALNRIKKVEKAYDEFVEEYSHYKDYLKDEGIIFNSGRIFRK